MARYFDIHQDNPQPRLIREVANLVRDGGLIAYPTDSSYALGCQLGNTASLARMKALRHLDDKHHFTLVCHDFAQLSQFVRVGNTAFRLMKASTPGRYTFILPATKEVPRKLMHPRQKTVGVRIPDNAVVQALVAELGEPIISTTLLLPGDERPMAQGWEVKDRLDNQVDCVVDAGDCGTEPTTVIDLSEATPKILRRGSGDTARFE